MGHKAVHLAPRPATIPVAVALASAALSARGCPKPSKAVGMNGLSWEYMAVNVAEAGTRPIARCRLANGNLKEWLMLPASGTASAPCRFPRLNTPTMLVGRAVAAKECLMPHFRRGIRAT